ncbi:MAG: PQQ-binding-like beta-propeller repeat protein, partial [Candidatus Nealsonbacteria bacterium]|nr:PQQ-binding-like beta-propeller repeat protein [Candidatus Nealsonbacteria bacterium]
WAGGSGTSGDTPLPRHGDFLWQYPADQAGESGIAVVAAAPALIGDAVIVPLANDKRKGLACLPGTADETPDERWFHSTENGVVLPPAALGTVSGDIDRVFVVDGRTGDQGRRLHCLDGSGKTLWRRPVAPEAGGHLLLRRGALIVNDRRDVLSCISLEGKTLWSSNVENPGFAAISEQGMLIVAVVSANAAESHQLIALDEETGKQLWHNRLDARVTTQPVVAAGSILVGTTEGCSRRSLIDGSAMAALITPAVIGNLLVDRSRVGGPRVWFGTTDGTLRVVDIETWRPLAGTQLGVNSGGLIKVRDRIIAAGDEKYYVVTFTAEGNEIDAEAWLDDVSWLGRPVAPFSSADGRLWVPAQGWGIMCLGGTP